MASYEEFLQVIKEGWNNTVTLPGFKVVDSHGGAGRGVATGAGVLVGGLAGGMIGYALSSGTKTKKKSIDTDIRVADKGIVISKATDEGSDLKIPWEDIINMEEGMRMINETILNLKNGIEIKITAPSSPGFLFSHYYIDEFINYVNEHAKGQPEQGW